MKMRIQPLCFTLLIALQCMMPSLSALSDPALAPIEDLDALFAPETRGGVLESIDAAYVRHPILCTIGFTLVSFVVLFALNPDVRKRVCSIGKRLFEKKDIHDEVVSE